MTYILAAAGGVPWVVPYVVTPICILIALGCFLGWYLRGRAIKTGKVQPVNRKGKGTTATPTKDQPANVTERYKSSDY